MGCPASVTLIVDGAHGNLHGRWDWSRGYAGAAAGGASRHPTKFKADHLEIRRLELRHQRGTTRAQARTTPTAVHDLPHQATLTKSPVHGPQGSVAQRVAAGAAPSQASLAAVPGRPSTTVPIRSRTFPDRMARYEFRNFTLRSLTVYWAHLPRDRVRLVGLIRP